VKNYYKILEVSENATQVAIKKSYRSLAKKYHPDKSSSAHAAQLFTEVNEAYGVLSDPEQKATYDLRRQGGTTRQHTYNRRPAYRSSRVQVEVTPYVPYFRMASFLGLALSLILTIDYFLPRDIQQERVTNIRRVMARHRGGTTYLLAVEVTTDNGIFRVGPNTAIYLGKDKNLDIERTVFLNKATSVKFSNSESLETYSPRASIYGNFSFALIVLLITSSIGSLLKKPPITILNFGIVNGVLVLLVLYFTTVS